MSQFEVLSETLPLARAAVFVQSEDTESGALEFFPVAVWPKVQPVFLVGEKTPAERALPKFSLPGGQDATSLLPSYPFLSPTGADGAPISTPLPDGGLSVPLAYKSDTFGVLALWRDGRRATPALSSRPGSDSAVMWSELERRQAERVARTLAVAAALDRATSAAAPPRPARRDRVADSGAGGDGRDERDGAPVVEFGGISRNGRRSGMRDTRPVKGEAFDDDDDDDHDHDEDDDVSGERRVAEVLESPRRMGSAVRSVDSESHELVLREVRALLQGSVHQLNSPLSAVRTLSKLLLRRLDHDAQDTVSRELARDILIQADRLAELVQPLDRLALSLPASTPSAEALDAEAESDDFDEASWVSASLFSPAPRLVPMPLRFNAADTDDLVDSFAERDATDDGAAADVDVDVGDVGGGDMGSDVGAFGTDFRQARFASSLGSGDDLDDDLDDDDDLEEDEEESIIFVSDVVQPVAELAARLAPERGVDCVYVSVDDDGDGVPGVMAPEAAIREATTNLIDNALKYVRSVPVASSSATRQSMVAVGCSWHAERARVLIEVWSSGPPLLEEELVSVLEWGVRGEAARAGGAEGTGFGLPIAQQLVQLLGGHLELVNSPMPQWAWRQQRAEQQRAVARDVPDEPPKSSWAAAGMDDDGMPLADEDGHDDQEATAEALPVAPSGVSARIWLPRAAVR